MQREVKKYLTDIQISISSIYDFLNGEKDFNKYKANKFLRRAIERELEIIGEATNRLLRLKPDIQISGARRIVNLRNWVIHTYDNVDDVIIWGIVSRDIPVLKIEVDELLNDIA